MTQFQRTVDELREVASLFWPEELSKEAADLSIIPLLLDTQDQFLSILSVDVKNFPKLLQMIEIATLPANLFLKHLVILADFGGEILQRVNDNFNSIFPTGVLSYTWKGNIHEYEFQELPLAGRLSNTKLNISGRKISSERKLDSLITDVIALLIFGSVCADAEAAEILSKCEISNYLGESDALKQFVKQRYIWVSRITTGSQSNTLGQLAQRFVKNYIEENLNTKDAVVQSNGTVPGITHNDKQTDRLTTFDIVVSKNNKHVAIEVSFQVTTNSVIERKAGQAQARYKQINDAGYKMVYVLDGAGNFQRENALSTICSHSHCTVAFSKDELDVLCQFIGEYLE